MYVFICTRTPCRYQNSWRSLIKNSAVFAYKPMHIFPYTLNFLSVQFSCSVVSNSATPWTRSTPGLPVHEFTQTHVHWVSDAIQPSHPLSSPSPPAFNLSQRQGFLKWVSIRWPKYWSFSFNISSSNEHPGLILLQDWISLQSKGLSRVFSNTTVQKHQFFDAQHSSQSNSYIHTWLWEKP